LEHFYNLNVFQKRRKEIKNKKHEDLPQMCSNYGAGQQGSLGQALVIKNRRCVGHASKS
jgi:hypothetical protein